MIEMSLSYNYKNKIPENKNEMNLFKLETISNSRSQSNSSESMLIDDDTSNNDNEYKKPVKKNNIFDNPLSYEISDLPTNQTQIESKNNSFEVIWQVFKDVLTLISLINVKSSLLILKKNPHSKHISTLHVY